MCRVRKLISNIATSSYITFIRHHNDYCFNNRLINVLEFESDKSIKSRVLLIVCSFLDEQL